MAERVRISSVGLGLWPRDMPRFTESEADVNDRPHGAIR
jgi:hypothetical protein